MMSDNDDHSWNSAPSAPTCQKIYSEKSFIDAIATCCIDKYSSLPKTGKPIQTEWTVLSCVVRYNSENRVDFEVVSMGTGSKCIGATKMSPEGDILNDSHAEVIARRGFLVYLYENMCKALDEKPSIFTIDNGKFNLERSIKFAFFSSQLPCGDAAIFPKADPELAGDILKLTSPLKRANDEKLCEISLKITKLDNETADAHRTGAKCLEGAKQDPLEAGCNYHLLSQVRTKPGRGDRTQSVSCSDKIARWIHVGIQGALLDMLLEEPIFLSRFIFGGGVPYSEESLRRAFFERNKGDRAWTCEFAKLNQSTLSFPHVRSENTTKPASGSILWVNTTPPILEVAVLGKKLGVTKKNRSSKTSQLSVSKYSLYTRFMQILASNNIIKKNIFGTEDISRVPYKMMKEKSIRYCQKWDTVKERFFGSWTRKNYVWDFTIGKSMA